MRKILLVDDSKSARYAMRTMLQKHNCEVDPVESAEVALEKIKENLPDAIFMDHLMPGMSGFDALDVIKANPKTAHIPVVMCTSNYEDVYQKQAREKGALGILPKPGTPESLAAMLTEIDAANAAKPKTVAAPAAPASATAAAASGSASDIQHLLDQLRAELTAKFTEQINKLRADLHQRESEYAQALIQKIAKEILPTMLAQGADQLEQRIVQRLSHGR
jgi:CheY-like chemotaxis protein